MKRTAYLLFLVLSVSVFAYEYIIPLPGLLGNYTQTTSSKTASFNAGTSFLTINSVHLVLEGQNFPGLCGGVECPLASCYGYLTATMCPDASHSGCYWYAYGGESVSQSYYDDYLSFRYTNFPGCPGGSWNFLLDGAGEISLYFSHGYSFCTLLQAGHATVTQACLVIDAIAPSFKFLNPTQGQMLPAGSVCQIQWEDTEDPGDYLSYLLEYSIDDGLNWLPLASLSQTYSYDWTVPDITSSACNLRLTKNSGSGWHVAYCDPFSIYQCQENIPGDFVKDCYINLKDFRIIASNWLASAECPEIVPGDINGDCHVGLDDLILFAQEWLRCTNPLDPACVQE